MGNMAVMLTRRQVAALLAVSEEDVKGRDGEAFHPVKGRDGSWRYPPEEVAVVMRGGYAVGPGFDPSGAVCSAAFKLFKESTTLVDVVIALAQTPTVVRGLRAEFDNLVGGLVLSAEIVAGAEKVLGVSIRNDREFTSLIGALERRLASEFDRGYIAGTADANDLGEIVDPATGARRSISGADAAAGLRAAQQRWSETGTPRVTD